MSAQHPAPLSLPSILINPKSKSAAQIQSFVAQQQEKAIARREGRVGGRGGDEWGMRRKGEGLRSLRRRENAILIHNPHASLPQRSDYLPPTPTHTPSFPIPTPRTLQSSIAPSPAVPTSDPFSSEAGAFSLSLKGVRQLLRKRGRRAEVVVDTVEGELVRWLDGLDSGNLFAREFGTGQPRIIDATDVSFNFDEESNISSNRPVAPTVPQSNEPIPVTDYATPFSTNSSTSSTDLSILLQSFYNSSALSGSSTQGHTRPALVELMRSSDHLIWAVADSFERLVVHLLCRYYELSSFSQTLPARNGKDSFTSYRITHIIIPTRLKAPPSQHHNILTPESTDIDTDGATAHDVSSSDAESFASIGDTDSEVESEVVLYNPVTRGRKDQTPTPRRPTQRDGSVDSDWSLAEPPTPSTGQGRDNSWTPIPDGTSHMSQLSRTITNDSDAFAGSDTSDGESAASLLDSLILGESTGLEEDVAASGGNPFTSSYNLPLARGHVIGSSTLPSALAPREERRRKVTFFEYLYG